MKKDKHKSAESAPKKKVLIVDDDEDMCEEMSELLEDEGYSVNKIFDGLGAKKLIENNSYDLLLLDIKMPRLNGIEILKGIREKDNDTKVIVLTGNLIANKLTQEPAGAEEKEEVRILKLAECVLSKPFDVEAVLAKIKDLLG
ncbi:MAG: response regulator [Candidatus Omnitrophica bacterium]|nr:response regulator [Candidatus Omnitrophota bacterium]